MLEKCMKYSVLIQKFLGTFNKKRNVLGPRDRTCASEQQQARHTHTHTHTLHEHTKTIITTTIAMSLSVKKMRFFFAASQEPNTDYVLGLAHKFWRPKVAQRAHMAWYQAVANSVNKGNYLVDNFKDVVGAVVTEQFVHDAWRAAENHKKGKALLSMAESSLKRREMWRGRASTARAAGRYFGRQAALLEQLAKEERAKEQRARAKVSKPKTVALKGRVVKGRKGRQDMAKMVELAKARAWAAAKKAQQTSQAAAKAWDRVVANRAEGGQACM